MQTWNTQDRARGPMMSRSRDYSRAVEGLLECSDGWRLCQWWWEQRTKVGSAKVGNECLQCWDSLGPHLAALNLQRRGRCSRYSPSLMDTESCQLPWESTGPEHCLPQTHSLPRDLVKGSAFFQGDVGWLGPSQQSSGVNCWDRESRTLAVCVRNWTFPKTRWLWSMSYDADILKSFLIRDPWREAKAPFCLFQMPGTAAAIPAQANPLGMVEWRLGRA